MINRPPSGSTIDLTDEQLAKIGLVAALEAQSKDHVWLAIKALDRLDGTAWVKRKNDKFFELTASALRVAENVDQQLFEVLTDVEQLRLDLGWRRNAILHATWANDGKGQLVTRDWKRGINLDLAALDEAIAIGSQLSLASKAAVMRIADLIASGAMQQGSPVAPCVHVRSSNNTDVCF